MPVPGGDHGEWQRSRSIAALRSGVGGPAGGNRSDRSRRVALGLGAYTPVVGRPSGTVTFLFTDVEGSTRLWAADSSAMSASLRAHDEILREAIESAGGYVFSTAGDSFAAAFDRVSAAVKAALDAQERLAAAAWAGPVLRVRIGLHLGEAEERGGDYFGPTVNTGARVQAAGDGGQTLVTEAARIAGRIAGVLNLACIGSGMSTSRCSCGSSAMATFPVYGSSTLRRRICRLRLVA